MAETLDFEKRVQIGRYLKDNPGASIIGTAEKFGVSENAVNDVARKFSLVGDRNKAANQAKYDRERAIVAYSETHTYEETAKKFQCDRNLPRKLRIKRGLNTGRIGRLPGKIQK